MKPQKDIILARFRAEDTSTLGRIYVNGMGPLCSMELPWKDNALRVSCIPEGRYGWSKWYSPTFKRTVIRLHDDEVMPRSAILIHPANWPPQILGCIAPGRGYNNWTDKGGWGVTSSRDAFGELMAAVQDSGRIHIADCCT